MMTGVFNHSDRKLQAFVENKLPATLHRKRVSSISAAVLGAITRGSLRPSAMGEGLAEANSKSPKHAKKQVDRLLSNKGIDVLICQRELAKQIIAKRAEILVAMDWTCFAKDGQITLTLRCVTSHGRATPLLWLTVPVTELKGRKVEYENRLLGHLHLLTAEKTRVVLLADREFGSIERFERLKTQYAFDYVIRFKGNTTITTEQGISKKAREWISHSRHTRCIKQAAITLKYYTVPQIVISKEKNMKDVWCLACSLTTLSTRTIKHYYGKRWSTETSYRDEKNSVFGMGLSTSRIKSTQRRDRLLLISALAFLYVTLLGAACERCRFDRHIRANTLKTRRTHSLFAQGYRLFKLLPTMKYKLLLKIMCHFQKIIVQAFDSKQTFSII